MKETAHLIDAQERHRARPDTFEVPSDARIAALRVGHMVKIGVSFPENDESMEAERFWVQILERRGDEFVGRVDNDLHFTTDHGLRLNDSVTFRQEHLFDTET